MRIAMIGAGLFAPRHLDVLSAEPNVQVVGHVSPTLKLAAAAAQRYGGRACTRTEDLLRHEEIDAAWVCVPPGSHGTIEQNLIERRIPFFVEKPLAADSEPAETIANAIAKSGLIVGVGYHWRAMDTIPEVKRTLAQNPARLVLGAWHDATPSPAWWRHQATSGGQMVEQATHLFDIARSLVGEAEVIATRASRHARPAYPDADVADVSTALLLFENGATGVFTATCLLNKVAAAQVQLVCEGLLITITQERVAYDAGREKREVRTGNDPVLAEDRAFLRALERNDPTLLFCDYAEALNTHRLCLKVRDSGEAHSAINLF